MDRGRRRQAREPHSKLLAPVATFVTRHPRLLVVSWLAVMGTLALLGRGLEHKVSAGTVFVAGAPAARAHDIAVREFGREDTLVVMLRGPGEELDRQGAVLVARLQALPQAVVLSPWNSRGSIKGLRPSSDVAAVLISVGDSPGGSAEFLSRTRSVIGAVVKAPVRASVAGGPAVVESLRDAVSRASAVGERLAIPVLLVVLLIVCRSLLAAAMPVLIGGFVAGATRGILDLLAGSVAIDSIAIGIAGMIGLALGVDYSLLIVARFREELELDGNVERAAQATVMRTGRAIVPAGCGLILALLAALVLLPGSYISSVVLAAASATALSVVSALFLAPAALILLGTHLNRWSLPRRRESGVVVMAWSRRLSRQPGFVLGLIFVLLFCSVWAFTLRSNGGVASLLPPNDPGRKAQEEVERGLGPGWVAPFEVLVAGGGQPVTTPSRLRALSSFQREVEKDPGVDAMAGFASLASATDALGSVPRQLSQQERGSVRLSQGTNALAHGFARTGAGAAQLASATGAARSGSGQLADGLQTSAAGSQRLSSGLGEASTGSGKLTRATRKTSDGANQLAAKVASARKQASEALASGAPLRNALRSGEASVSNAPLQATEAQLATAWQALQDMSVGREDPRYPALENAIREATRELNGVDPASAEGEPPGSVAGSVADALGQFELARYLAGRQEHSQRQAQDGIAKLASASKKLDGGLGRLLRSSRQLRSGIARLSQHGEELPPGMRRLSAGAGRLLAGLGQLEGGADNLSASLGPGAPGSPGLGDAVRRLHDGAERSSQAHSSGLKQQSPAFFRSGYYYLAGFDGSPPERRNQFGFLVNIAQGGSAARMLVIPTHEAASEGAKATEARLSTAAGRLARETHAEVVVGGLSPALVELNSALRDQTPMARLVLSGVTILILLLVTQSLALPIISALLNLLTVSVTFGILSLLFNGSLLGGPGFVDSSVIPATVVLTFGLAVDYEVFILSRIREEYLRTGSTAEAIENGLSKTAPVISGAAVIMIAVFLAFAISPLMILRNLGVGLAAGVVIDAFLVRFVLLPAAMRALGDRCWWVPRWLDRILPGGRPALRTEEA
jgi:putative drug exporter of the RND superfamily